MSAHVLDDRRGRGAAARAQQPTAGDPDGTTRERVLELIIADGPVTAATLARELGLTPAAVRRHLSLLEADSLIVVHEAGHPTGRRGRPARRYVATSAGQAEMAGAYSDLATQALRFLRETAGEQAVERFAHERLEEVARRYAPHVTATGVGARAQQLADALSDDGYAASVRPVAGTATVQLCQGHCPVQHVAEEFPQLCEAEAQVFSRLLGSHVQRLSTLAGGGHACTTNVPTTNLPRGPTVAGDLPAPPGRRGGPDSTSTPRSTTTQPPTRLDGTWKE